MKTIGAARLSIIADARGMASGVKDAKRHVGVLSSTLSNASKMVAGFVGAFAASKAIGVFKDQMEKVGEVVDVSTRLGLATEELIGLRHAADVAGIGASEFDTSFAKMMDGVADAQSGIGGAREAFRQLGIDMTKLDGSNPQDIFYQVADALDKVGDSSKKMQLARDIFGRGGASMLSLTDGGSATTKAFQGEAGKLGMLYSKEESVKFDAADDAIERLKKALGSLTLTIVGNLAPEIEIAANTFTEWTTSLRSSTGGFSTFIDIIKASVYAIGAVFDRLGAASTELLSAFAWVGSWFSDDMKILHEELSRVSQEKNASADEKSKKADDYFWGENKPTVDEGVADRVAKKREFAAQEEKTEIFADAAKKIQSIQDEIDKLRMGEEAFLAKQLESMGYTAEMIQERLAIENELKKVQQDQLNLTKQAAEAEQKKQQAIADQKAVLQEQRNFARSIFEEGQTEYERGILRQKEILDAYNRGDIDGRDAQMALKANTSGVMDSMRSKAQGESTATEFHTRGSAAAYNAIVNALGQKDKQAEIANNTKLMYAEAQKTSRSLEQLVAKRESYNAEVTVEDNI